MNDARHLLITGASSGIGAEAARRLQTMGHRLTLLCRSEQAEAQTRLHLGPSPPILIADLADLEAVDRISRQLIDEADVIDTLVLNAGLQLAGTRAPQWSRQGIELTFAVNQLAHQRLLENLLPLLKRGHQPRAVITASDVHNPLSGGGRVGRPADLGSLDGLRSGTGFAMVFGGMVNCSVTGKMPPGGKRKLVYVAVIEQVIDSFRPLRFEVQRRHAELGLSQRTAVELTHAVQSAKRHA